MKNLNIYKLIFFAGSFFVFFFLNSNFTYADPLCGGATWNYEVRGSCAINPTSGQVCNVSGNPGDCYVQGNNVICNTYSTCDYTTYVCEKIFNVGTGVCDDSTANCTPSTLTDTRLCQNISGAKITCNSPPNSIACPSNDPCTTYACVGSGANAFCSPTATGACSGGGGGNCGDTICAGAPFETSSSCPQDCGGAGPTCPLEQQLSIYIPNDGQTTAQGSAITYTVNIGTQDFGDNQFPFTISAVCPIGALCAWEAQSLTSGTVTKTDATAGTGLVTQTHYLTIKPQFETTAGSYAVTITASINGNNVCTASTAANLTVTNGPTFVPGVYIDSYLSGQPQIVNGQIQIYGWALDNPTQPETAISNVKIYVDGVLAGTANYGTDRNDVCAVYPGRVGCPYVGWFYYLNTSSYGNGVRNISAVAQDAQGQLNSFSINVNIQNPVAVNGACGSANKTYLNTDTSYGTDTYCTSGTPSSSPAFPAVGASVTWTCNGSNGGSNSGTCTATRAAATINGACGTSNGGTFTAAPSSSLCNAGNATAVSGSGPWTWSCNSPNGGTNASCSANRAPALTFSPSSYSLTAAAGASVNGSNLTITNSAPAGASNLTWAVSVTTNSGGAWLTASRAFAGQTQSGTEVPGGSATPAISVTANAASLAAGTYTGTITLTSNDPTKLSNSIPVTFTVTAVVNGSCGTSNGGTFTSAPSSNLCTTGTASAVSGSGPWTWNCTGSGGGSTASCSAQIQPRAVVAPASLSFTTPSGTVAPTQDLTVRNNVNSAVNLTWNASITSGNSWMTISRTSGSEPANWTSAPPIVVTASATSLSLGTYNGNIRITSNDTLSPTINVPVTFTVTAPLCPAASVTLTPASIAERATSVASAPAGFSGGSFVSSNSGIASVSGTTITGNLAGTANISGSGWNYTNGATNCSLTAAALTVVLTDPLPILCTGGCGACNSSACGPTPSGGATYPACGMVRITWVDNSNNETGFKIYRDGVLITTVATTNQVGTGGVMTYDYTTPDNNPHAYSVAATNGAGDSSQVTVTSPGGIASVPCTPNLTSSDKDIVGINGKKIGTGLGNQCGGTDALPASVSLKDGDLIKFSINICNTGTLAASGITVTDTMVNLVLPTTGWNAKYDDGTGEKPLSNFGITTSYVGNQLTFSNIPNVPVGTTRRITFNAQLSKPVGFTGQSARFQNGFSITSNALTASGNTPLLPFYTGTGDSSIIEVP